MTVDACRDAVRAMTAVDHFGTDYLPLDSGAGKSAFMCDVEPGIFAVFTFAVLALHQEAYSGGRGILFYPAIDSYRGPSSAIIGFHTRISQKRAT